MLSRRRFLTSVVALGLGTLLPSRAARAQEDALMYCSWVNSGVTRCYNGVLEQRWDFLCCEGIGCEVWNEEWRPIGSC